MKLERLPSVMNLLTACLEITFTSSNLKYKFHHNQIKCFKALVLNLKLNIQMVYISNSCVSSMVSEIDYNSSLFYKITPFRNEIYLLSTNGPLPVFDCKSVLVKVIKILI